MEGAGYGVSIIGAVCLDLEVEEVLELVDVGLELDNAAAEGRVGGVDVWRGWRGGVVRAGVGMGGVGERAVARAGVVPVL
jgi:hypothetical protein